MASFKAGSFNKKRELSIHLYKKEKTWGSWLSGGCASKSSDCESRVSDYRLKK